LERSLSVLLPVYNLQSRLSAMVRETLEVLSELTRRFEVVIIDDGSTDATIEVADELATHYPQVRIFRHAVHLGRAAAIRTGLDRSTGEIILLQDADGRLPIDEVHKLWRRLDQEERFPWRPRTTPRPIPALPSHLDAVDPTGAQIFHRRAIEPMTDSPSSDPPEDRVTGPRRPNYLAKLTDFALGE